MALGERYSNTYVRRYLLVNLWTTIITSASEMCLHEELQFLDTVFLEKQDSLFANSCNYFHDSALINFHFAVLLSFQFVQAYHFQSGNIHLMHKAFKTALNREYSVTEGYSIEGSYD